MMCIAFAAKEKFAMFIQGIITYDPAICVGWRLGREMQKWDFLASK